MIASIFTPADETLAAKVSAFKAVYRANEQMQASMDLNSPDWQDRLGDKQDVVFAQATIANSFNQACASLSAGELKQAQDDELLTDKEIQSIVIAQRKAQSHERLNQQSRSRGRSR